MPRVNKYWNREIKIRGISFKVDTRNRPVMFRLRGRGKLKTTATTKTSAFRMHGTPRDTRGRKATEINFDRVRKMARKHATVTEISQVIGVSRDALLRNAEFRVIYEKEQEHGHYSLRRRMYELACKGDRTMLIWLGKQYLGMKDHAATEQSGTINHNVAVKPDLSKLSVEELENLRNLLIKAKGNVVEITPTGHRLIEGGLSSV